LEIKFKHLPKKRKRLETSRYYDQVHFLDNQRKEMLNEINYDDLIDKFKHLPKKRKRLETSRYYDQAHS